MIKYKATIGEVTTELECQTIGELIEYLNYDKEDQEEESRVVVEADQFTVGMPDDIPMYDSKKDSWTRGSFLVNAKDLPSSVCLMRQDNSVHFPKTEIINGELWFVNDGQQPVGDSVRVDMLLRCKDTIDNEPSCGRNWKLLGCEAPPYKNRITHWRIAK